MNRLINLATRAFRAAAPYPLGQINSKVDIPKIYFCHIPKSAGSSIATAIREQVYSRYNLDGFNIEQGPSLRAARTSEKSMMQAREVVLAYNLAIERNFFGKGHCYCRPNLVKEFSNEWNFITVLRNPIDRWISEYVYNTYKRSSWTKNKLPLKEYLESKKAATGGQQLIRFFSNYSLDFRASPGTYVDQALENLSQFAIVGKMENLDTWTTEITNKFSLKIEIPTINKSPRNQAVEQVRSDPAVMRKIENLCKYDLELYNEFTERYGNLYSNPKITGTKRSL